MKESKVVKSSFDFGLFGWVNYKTEHHRHGPRTTHEYYLERDLNLNSDDIKRLNQLEIEYKVYSMSVWSKPCIDIEMVLMMFLLLIIPGIIYLIYAIKQLKKEKIQYEINLRKVEEIRKEAAALITKSSAATLASRLLDVAKSKPQY